jgi:hypothetical protein
MTRERHRLLKVVDAQRAWTPFRQLQISAVILNAVLEPRGRQCGNATSSERLSYQLLAGAGAAVGDHFLNDGLSGSGADPDGTLIDVAQNHH